MRAVVKGREWPWFSGLRWWQKVGIASAFLVLILVLLLLPRTVSGDLIASLAFGALAAAYLRLSRRLSVLFWLALTAVVFVALLATAHVAPYAVVIVAVMALLLSVVIGWREAGDR